MSTFDYIIGYWSGRVERGLPQLTKKHSDSSGNAKGFRSSVPECSCFIGYKDILN